MHVIAARTHGFFSACGVHLAFVVFAFSFLSIAFILSRSVSITSSFSQSFPFIALLHLS